MRYLPSGDGQPSGLAQLFEKLGFFLLFNVIDCVDPRRATDEKNHFKKQWCKHSLTLLYYNQKFQCPGANTMNWIFRDLYSQHLPPLNSGRTTQ